MSANDKVIFAEEIDIISKNQVDAKKWKLIIADDEEEIHQVTRMVLEDTILENKKIQFLSSYSGHETIKLIKDNPDTAIVLLDVVMETDDAGLKVAKYIREELKNNLVRIILRTGQPGQAPERKIITEYDINDYKEKTELTAQKLYTTVLSSLRSYRDLKTIQRNKKNLEMIINNAGILFETQSIINFSLNVIKQLSLLTYENDNIENKTPSGFTISIIRDEIKIIIGTGRFEKIDLIYKNLSPDLRVLIDEAIEEKQSKISKDFYLGYFKSELDSVFVVYYEYGYEIACLDTNIVHIFSTNILAAYDNIDLNKEIIETQKEIILTLGEVVETRSKETAYHVQRVAEISRLIAIKLGLNDEESELIRMASPMHDVGKIGIPDAILNKPARLTTEEFEEIKTHTTIGYDILKSSSRKILQTAAIIAAQHHEWWNGNGYPSKIKGNDIHIYSRITALVDVFDALLHKRAYKDAWGAEKVIQYLKDGSGKQFDPEIVEIFLNNTDEIFKIVEKYRN